MASKYTNEEKMERLAYLIDSSQDVFSDAEEAMIEELHEQLDLETEFQRIRFIQGQIAGIKYFCSVNKQQLD